MYCFLFFFFFLVSLWYTRQVLAGLLVITDKALNKDTVFAYFCLSSFPSVQFSFSLIWAQYSFTYKIKLRGNKLYPMIVSILKGSAWGVCFHFFYYLFSSATFTHWLGDVAANLRNTRGTWTNERKCHVNISVKILIFFFRFTCSERLDP